MGPLLTLQFTSLRSSWSNRNGLLKTLVPGWDILRAGACPPGCGTYTEPRPICGAGPCNWSTTGACTSCLGLYNPSPGSPLSVPPLTANREARFSFWWLNKTSGDYPTSESGLAWATPSLCPAWVSCPDGQSAQTLSRPSIKGHLD